MQARRKTASRRQETAQVAVVTGPGRGIGGATAGAFAAQGHTVIIAERVAELGRRAARALVDSGIRAIFLGSDVGDLAPVDDTVRTIVTRLGRIDCLVNNAGNIGWKQWKRIPLERAKE